MLAWRPWWPGVVMLACYFSWYSRGWGSKRLSLKPAWGTQWDPDTQPLKSLFSKGWGLEIIHFICAEFRLDWSCTGLGRTTLSAVSLWEMGSYFIEDMYKFLNIKKKFERSCHSEKWREAWKMLVIITANDMSVFIKTRKKRGIVLKASALWHFHSCIKCIQVIFTHTHPLPSTIPSPPLLN